MANTIIKGNNLMLFDQNGHSIAYATNHSLTLSGDTQDISSKDHGVWGATSVLKVNWEITSENLYTTEDFDSPVSVQMHLMVRMQHSVSL